MKNFSILFKKPLSEKQAKLFRGSLIKLKMLQGNKEDLFHNILKGYGFEIPNIKEVMGVELVKACPVVALRRSDSSFVFENFSIMNLNRVVRYHPDTILTIKGNYIICVKSKILLRTDDFYKTAGYIYSYNKWCVGGKESYRLVIDDYGNISERVVRR